MVFNNNLLIGAASASAVTPGAGYTIDNSCIFDGADASGGELEISSVGTPTAGTKGIWSFWTKNCKPYSGTTVYQWFCGSNTSGAQFMLSFLETSGKLGWYMEGNDTISNYQSSAIYVDPTAWYHVMYSMDTTTAATTAADRLRMYINGKQITSFSTQNTMDQDEVIKQWNVSGGKMFIGTAHDPYKTQHYNGYFAEFMFLDGKSIQSDDYTVDSFVEINSDGVCIPVDPATAIGTSGSSEWGNNGFWLEFEDNSSAAALGTDSSGNGNDFSVSGLATSDQTTDSPTDSGTTIGNYAIWNPLFLNASMDGTATNTYSNGNRTYIGGDAGGGGMPCSTLPMAIGSNSYYVEVTYDVVSAGYQYSGLSFIPTTPASGWGNIIFYAADDGKVYTESGSSTYGDTWGAGDAIGIYYDNDNDELSFYKNGVDQGVAATSLSSNGSIAHVCCYFGRSTDKATINSGQSAFIGTAPEGALPLCTANLPAPTVTKPTDQFLPIVYEGNGTSQRVGDVDSTAGITGLIVYKNADATDNWVIQDRCQGIYKWWPFNIGAAQATDTESTQEFLAGGTTIGDMDNINTSGESITGRMWANDGTETTNAVGTITTTKTRVNDDAGFSMTIYNGTGANATVGHGLSAAPGLVIVSNLPGTTSNVAWSEGMDATDYIEIDGSGAATTDATAWNSTAPSATVVSLGSSSTTNDSGTAHIMYCWRAIEGYSYFGTHPGNGFSDGPFIYIGHAPAYFFQKNISGGEHWLAVGNDLNSYNPWSDFFSCNIANATRSDANMKMAQIASGIKVRGTEQNVSGSTYTIWSWAIHPFGGSGVAQGKAR